MLSGFQLDSGSAIPLYRQLSDQLRDMIQSGRLEPGEKLPATRELAGSLGLNRATVTAAYELLEAQGLLKGHVGRGSYVEASSIVAPQPDFQPPPALALSEGGFSFASSRPAVELFPIEEFRAACEETIRSEAIGAILQLGSPSGYPPLRRYLLDTVEGIRSSDDLLVTSGCQQAIDLIQRLFVRPGDAVAIEDPVYPGLRNVFTAAGAKVIGVPAGETGMDVPALEAALRRDRPKLIVVTPNFQNPTGTTLPLEARQSLLKLARDAGATLVENDIYGALRYRGQSLPSLKQLDRTGGTILLGSFSKLAFPGLRVGWIVAPKPVIARLTEAKQWCDLHSDQLSQGVLLRFAESGRLAAHRESVVRAGEQRLRAALAACQKHLPAGSRWTRPDGGMSMWVRLPEPLDSSELLPRAERAGANYLPGRVFAVSRTEAGAFRLCFAGLPPDRIEAGLAILGNVFREELERVRAARRMHPAPALV